jgi:hypothetical protein
MYFPDGTGYYVSLTTGIIGVGNRSSGGWSMPEPDEELEGAALVAPLSILFWEKE